jgi:GMP synthase (glutamine-hydrolysing)
MRILSVTHGPTVPGGVFDEVAEHGGHELERWVVPFGRAPRSPRSYGAVMVFGGSMHPDQDEHFGWLAREAEFLQEVLAEDVPAIGVCLGAQMLARAAGASVAPAGAPEIGWVEIELTEAGRADPVLETIPPRVEAFQWHHYTYSLPDGAVELARSDICTQAFRRGRAWGIQFHAEVTAAMVEAWAGEDDGELPIPPHELLALTATRIAAWNELGRALSTAFLELAASG